MPAMMKCTFLALAALAATAQAFKDTSPFLIVSSSPYASFLPCPFPTYPANPLQIPRDKLTSPQQPPQTRLLNRRSRLRARSARVNTLRALALHNRPLHPDLATLNGHPRYRALAVPALDGGAEESWERGRRDAGSAWLRGNGRRGSGAVHTAEVRCG
jgi:hypothetical protein